MKMVYRAIKALKRVFGPMSITSFGIKQLLRKPVFVKLDEDEEGHYCHLLFKVLFQPELRRHFEKFIDFEKWEHYVSANLRSNIPLICNEVENQER